MHPRHLFPQEKKGQNRSEDRIEIQEDARCSGAELLHPDVPQHHAHDGGDDPGVQQGADEGRIQIGHRKISQVKRQQNGQPENSRIEDGHHRGCPGHGPFAANRVHSPHTDGSQHPQIPRVKLQGKQVIGIAFGQDEQHACKQKHHAADLERIDPFF